MLFHVNHSCCILLTYNMKWALLFLSVLPCIKALDLAPEKVEDASREGKGIKKFQIWFDKNKKILKIPWLGIKSLYLLSYDKLGIGTSDMYKSILAFWEEPKLDWLFIDDMVV